MSLRWAILGAGRIVQEEILRALPASNGCALVGIAGRSERRIRERLAGESALHGLRIYANAEAALIDPNVDAVYLALPNGLHATAIESALDAGKHVLCEKPLALGVADAERAWALAEQRDLHLAEGFMWRHQARVARLDELVQSGAVGTVRAVRASYTYPWLTDDKAIADAADSPRLAPRGGGALWDVGPYCVDGMYQVLGVQAPVSLAAVAASEGAAPVSTRVATQSSFIGGVHAQLRFAMDGARDERLEIAGSLGSITLPRAFRLRAKADPYELILEVDGERTMELFPYEDQYRGQFEAFASAVADGRLRGERDRSVAVTRTLAAIETAVAEDPAAAYT